MHLFDWIYKLFRWSLGGIFIYAGSVKLMAPSAFAAAIAAYGILPDSLQLPAAVGLSVLEVAAGIGLIADIHGSLSLVAVLLALFVAVQSYAIRLGLDIDCGCFGPGDPEAGVFHGLRLSRYRNLVMLASVAFLYAWRRYRMITPLKLMLLTNILREKGAHNDAER